MEERIFSVAHYADQGVLYLLIALSLVSFVMIIERYFALGKYAKASSGVRKRMKSALATGELEAVESLANRNSHSLEARALSCAMDHIEKNGTAGLEQVFNAFQISEKPAMERYLGFLGTVGSNAPYIGLFGTVLGIMKAFHDMSKAGDGGQQTVIAGISAALIATAAGLMVAIPAVLAFNYFQKQVKSIFASVDAVKEWALAYAEVKGSRHGS